MPDALIVPGGANAHQTIQKMVNIGLIKMVSCNGVPVYGRQYLTNRAIRLAYKKQKERKE